jgi:transposase
MTSLIPHDLVQLKYETIRAVEVDGRPIAQASVDFGLSRPTIYETQENFRHEGFGGLLPQKRGPKKARKLTPEVRFYLEELVASEPDLKAAVLAKRVRRRFGIFVHPRTGKIPGGRVGSTANGLEGVVKSCPTRGGHGSAPSFDRIPKEHNILVFFFFPLRPRRALSRRRFRPRPDRFWSPEPNQSLFRLKIRIRTRPDQAGYRSASKSPQNLLFSRCSAIIPPHHCCTLTAFLANV